ncbi:MAG: hypothetical protein HDT43_05175 [Ruminococcaceae bacterium]|nr:hypothetical protein [Oscillospiraceae bacterium]
MKKYILYKLRGMRGMTVASAVFNFLSTTLVGAVFVYFVDVLNKMALTDDSDVRGRYMLQCSNAENIVLIAEPIAIAVLAVLISVTPAVAFRFFVKRDLTDTLGSLPMTYRQRFWGDFLSGLTAHMLSFIPCSAVGLIITAIANGSVSDGARELSFYSSHITNLIEYGAVKTYMSYILLLFVGYMGAYAVSCLVTACCGRTGSAVTYSLISQIFPSGLVFIYSLCAFENSIGVDPTLEFGNMLTVIPSLGLWLSAIWRFNLHDVYYSGYYSSNKNVLMFQKGFFLNDQPIYLVIAAAVIAVIIAGAYFLGKLRKNEKTGRDFVFAGAYHVIAVSSVMFLIGLIHFIQDQNFSANIFITLILAFVVYAVIEVVHMRTFKWLWMTALRFAAIGLAFGCVTFWAYLTRGFGVDKYIPPRALISEVRITGTQFIDYYFLSGEKGFVYRSDEAIDAILSEHKKIVDSINEDADFGTNSALTIIYVLKDGSEVVRSYGPIRYTMDGELARENAVSKACAAIKQLTPTDSSALGFVDDPQYDTIGISYRTITHDSHLGYIDSPAVYVAQGKEEELMELLKRDLINNFSYHNYTHPIGEINIDHSTNGTDAWEQYFIYDDYTNALEFLNDPANVTDKPPAEKEFTYVFRLLWGYWDMTSDDNTSRGEGETIDEISIGISSTDDSAIAKELVGYIKPMNEVSSDEISKNINIISTNLADGALCVTAEDEQAVISAMLKYIRTYAE